MKTNRPLLHAVLLLIAALCVTTRAQGHGPEWPSIHDTVAEVTKRLAAAHSTEELEALATRGDQVLAALTPKEREILGKGLIRFRVNVPVTLHVAAPAGTPPFWLTDQGYEKTPEWIADEGTEFDIYRKRHPAGWVALGVNSLDTAPPAHYAVFLRPAEEGARLRTDHLYPGRLRWTRAQVGENLYRDAENRLCDLPPALAGSLMLQTFFEERHVAAPVRARVWRTRYPASATPDHVVVSFGADPKRTLSWTWRTNTKVTRSAVRLVPAAPDGRGPAAGAQIRTYGGRSEVVHSAGLVNDPLCRRHRVVVTHLEPDTTYLYALPDGAGWTPWRSVKTAPASPRDFGFLYMGDAQNGLDTWGRLIRGAYNRRPDIDFILMAGDLVDRGNERSDWDLFFQNAQGVFDRVPMLPCPGNHEYQGGSPRMYRQFLAVPGNGPVGVDPGLVYSFEYSDAFVASLDSNLGNRGAAHARRQAEWLDAALAKSTATWKFVMFHHPIYSSAPKRDNPVLRDHWVPIFDRHGVDMVLQGHDHAYLRTYPMRANRRVGNEERGTVYVVSVSGTKYYDQATRDYTERGFTNTSTYQTLDFRVRGGRLIYRALDINGREVDRLELQK